MQGLAQMHIIVEGICRLWRNKLVGENDNKVYSRFWQIWNVTFTAHISQTNMMKSVK